MTLDSYAFMMTMEKRIGFTSEDKALLKSYAEWGKAIALKMAEHFYNYMIDLAFIEQAYIEVSSAAVLKETGWTEGLFKRLIATGAGSM